MTVVVFGSINMDLVVQTPRAPVAGETLIGQRFFTAPGGKGANQAVAAARLGAVTRMVGRVGADAFGAALRDNLRAAGVDVAGVLTDAQESSGVALITVAAAGENRIIVVPGANGALDAADVGRLRTALVGARVLLLQAEVPLIAVQAAAVAARAAGVLCILDPAPVPVAGLPPDLLALADILTPNEGEAAALVDFPLDNDAAVMRAATVLHAGGARQVVITRGAAGIYWSDGTNSGFQPALPVAAVDTVGAGDA
ncbi:MAG: ribokinase, partial [Chloroflexota bacterium]|nr:ribokinase [Chloroflexota bacterium]